VPSAGGQRGGRRGRIRRTGGVAGGDQRDRAIRGDVLVEIKVAAGKGEIHTGHGRTETQAGPTEGSRWDGPPIASANLGPAGAFADVFKTRPGRDDPTGSISHGRPRPRTRLVVPRRDMKHVTPAQIRPRSRSTTRTAPLTTAGLTADQVAGKFARRNKLRQDDCITVQSAGGGRFHESCVLED